MPEVRLGLEAILTIDGAEILDVSDLGTIDGAEITNVKDLGTIDGEDGLETKSYFWHRE